MRRAGQILLICVVLIGAAVASYWLVSYHPTEFRGAGAMRDTGFFSYPRYHAPLGEVPLAAEGSYSFRFSGVPSETMWLQLYVPGYSFKDRDDLERVSTQISVRIADSAGNVVCQGSGQPSARDPNDRWVLMSSHFEAAFWHNGCNKREFKRGREYSLDVSVKNVDPKSPKVVLKAMLEGGGNELP